MSGKPLAILSLEHISADHLYDALICAMRERGGGAAGGGPVGPVLRYRAEGLQAAPPSRQFSRRAQALRPGAIVVADTEIVNWLGLISSQPDMFELLYLRPGINLLSELLPAVTPRPDRLTWFKWKLVRWIDEALANFAAVSVEDLFYKPQKVADRLRLEFGLPIERVDFAADVDAKYANILPSIMRLADGEDWLSNIGVTGYEVEKDYAATKTSVGSVALTQGWSHSEDYFTWNVRRFCVLTFPLQIDSLEGRGDLSLSLSGYATHGPWIARFYVDGKLVETVAKSAGDPRETTISIPLSLAALQGARPVVQVDCRFNDIHCPVDDGLGHGRYVSFALRSFRFSDEFRAD